MHAWLIPCNTVVFGLGEWTLVFPIMYSNMIICEKLWEWIHNGKSIISSLQILLQVRVYLIYTEARSVQNGNHQKGNLLLTITLINSLRTRQHDCIVLIHKRRFCYLSSFLIPSTIATVGFSVWLHSLFFALISLASFLLPSAIADSDGGFHDSGLCNQNSCFQRL